MREPDSHMLAESAHLERVLVAGLAEGYPAPEVTEEDLTDQVARAAYRAVRTLQRQGLGQGGRVEVDSILLRQQLVAQGEPEAWSLIEAVRPVMSGEFDAALHAVQRETQVRALLAVCRRIERRVQHEGREMSAAEIAEWATAEMGAATAGAAGDRLVTDEEVLRDLEERALAGNLRQGYVGTGLQDLDAITGGCGPQELIILAADPSVGKSALASQWITTIIRTTGPVFLQTMEMSAEAVMTRMARQIARAAREHLGPEHFRTARNLARKGPLIIADHGYGVELLAARIARIKMRHPDLAAVFVDPIGLLQGDPRAKGHERVASITRRLKSLAGQHRVPIVALHHLNRDSSKMGRRPELHDLREAGEADANQVLMLYRPGFQGKEHERGRPGPGELIIRKNRDGGVGTVHLWWEPDTVTFAPAPAPEQAPHPADDDGETYGLPPSGWAAQAQRNLGFAMEDFA